MAKDKPKLDRPQPSPPVSPISYTRSSSLPFNSRSASSFDRTKSDAANPEAENAREPMQNPSAWTSVSISPRRPPAGMLARISCLSSWVRYLPLYRS